MGVDTPACRNVHQHRERQHCRAADLDRLPSDALRPVIESIWHGDAAANDGPDKVDVCGHRIVQGGKRLRDATQITPEVRSEIVSLAEFAPEHNRLEVEGIDAAQTVLGKDVPQVAVFDTALHRTLSPEACYLSRPRWLAGRRYPALRISRHQPPVLPAAQLRGRPRESLNLIRCHLGNGASLAAIRGGSSIDTTMGFTPLERLMTLNPLRFHRSRILIYMVRHGGYRADQLDHVLNKESA
jgi:acetate kinase